MFFHRFEVESVEDVAGSVIDGGLGSGSGRRGHRSRSRRGLSPDRKESEGDQGLVHATEGSLVQIRRMPGGGTEEPERREGGVDARENRGRNMVKGW